MNNASQADQRPDDDSPTTKLSLLLFVSAALAVFFTALFAGGQPWAVILLLILVVHAFTDRRLAGLAVVVPAFGWLALFRLTGNRELFFPFSMYLAAHVTLLLDRRSLQQGAMGGIAVVVAFLAVRCFQRATGPVLAVELVVAAGILGLILLASAVIPKNRGTHLFLAVAASWLAFWGLSI